MRVIRNAKNRRRITQEEYLIGEFKYLSGNGRDKKIKEYQNIKRIALRDGKPALVKLCNQRIKIIKQMEKEKKGE
jgi:hypothetical protein